MVEHDPATLRKIYFQAWQKHLQKEPLTPMEAMIADIIQRHPEYHPIFSQAEDFEQFQNEKYVLDHNPFFHLALHVTIAEQVSTDRPKGIHSLYQQLLKKLGDQTLAEHKIMSCLANLLMTSFERNDTANEELYLEAIRRLL